MPAFIHYTPADRQQTLDALLVGLKAGDRIAGVIVVGSGAGGDGVVFRGTARG